MKPRFLTSIVLFTLLLLLTIAFNLTPYLRGPAEWRWAYAIPGQPWRLLLPATVLLIYLSVVLSWQRRLGEGRCVWGFLLFLWLAVPIIQLSLLAVNSPHVVQQLFFRTISATSSGFFSVGSAINDPTTFFSQYPQLMPTFPVHPQRYPPGIPAAFYFFSRVMGRMPDFSAAVASSLRLYQCQDFNLMRLLSATLTAALLQMSLPLWSGLVLFPLFGLARLVSGRRTALLVVVLYPLVPSFAMWAGRWDQFFPLLVVTGWYFFCWGWLTSRRWAFLVAGVVLSLASFFSFGLVTIVLPMGLWALLRLVAEKSWRNHLPLGLLFGVGLVSGWVIYQLVWGVGFWQIWQVSMGFHLGLARSYWVWLGYHLYDFGLFLGVPLAILFWTAVIHAIRQPKAIHFFPLAFGVGLLLLDLSGTSRGEVARVWLFLTPFAVLCAAHYLTQMVTATTGQITAVAALLALQLLLFTAFLRVVTTGVDEPPTHQRLFNPPFITHTLTAEFGEGIQLLGYDTPQQIQAGAALPLTLYWQARGQVQRPYTVFVHLVAADETLVAQQDNMPVNNGWPTTCWVADEVVVDVYQLAIPADAVPGVYQLVTGLYWWETGERLTVTGSSALGDGRVGLAEIEVTAP